MFYMFHFFLLLGSFHWVTSAYSAELFETVAFEGYAYHNDEKLIRNVPIKVGSKLTAKSEISSIDVNFKNSFFRLTDGIMEVQEGHFAKGSRDVLNMAKGKAYFYLDKSFGNNFFQLSTPFVIVSITGQSLSKPTKFYIQQTKDAFRMYMHKGHMEITLLKYKKILVDINDGQYFEYDGKAMAKPIAYTDERKIKKMQVIFEKFAPPHSEDTIYVHPTKREMLKL